MSMPLYNRIQLYAENTSVKFPLADTAETSVPSAALVDMNVVTSADPGTVFLTNLVSRNGIVFLSIERLSGGVWYPVCHLATRNPDPWRAYEMTAETGNSGWVVFGPDIAQNFEVVGETAELDARVLRRPITGATFTELEVNGITYAMPSVLTLRYNGWIGDSFSTRTVEEETPPPATENVAAMVLARNDEVVTDGMRRFGLVSEVQSDENSLFTINGVPADSDGIFTITFSSTGQGMMGAAEATHQDSTMGMVLHTSCVEGCEETDVDRAIRDGRKGHGVPYSLPLDEFVEDTTGRVQCTP